ncbi:hypothetical protein [Zooshikella ganghwensis]|uniref:Uncharacterized protein n=1 Tax=Zooshikella ganghwensis TaxID=202772 RepID=A0A4P9VHT0_9GAMM|nr:hypothetical protein [Zooshikella ganghwensis]RDH41989.1 hypothetical protein B9G39_00190 [Zooshikella ganghwensis]
MNHELFINEEDIDLYEEWDDKGRLCLWSILGCICTVIEDEETVTPNAWFKDEGRALIQKLAQVTPLNELVNYQKRLELDHTGNPHFIEHFYTVLPIALRYAQWLSPVVYKVLSERFKTSFNRHKNTS